MHVCACTCCPKRERACKPVCPSLPLSPLSFAPPLMTRRRTYAVWQVFCFALLHLKLNNICYRLSNLPICPCVAWTIQWSLCLFTYRWRANEYHWTSLVTLLDSFFVSKKVLSCKCKTNSRHYTHTWHLHVQICKKSITYRGHWRDL